MSCGWQTEFVERPDEVVRVFPGRALSAVVLDEVANALFAAGNCQQFPIEILALRPRQRGTLDRAIEGLAVSLCSLRQGGVNVEYQGSVRC